MKIIDKDLGELSPFKNEPITWSGYSPEISFEFEIEGDKSGPFEPLKERLFHVEKNYRKLFIVIDAFLKQNIKAYPWSVCQNSWEIDWISFYKVEQFEFIVNLLFNVDDQKPMENWIGNGNGFVGNGVFLGELQMKDNIPTELVMVNTKRTIT